MAEIEVGQLAETLATSDGVRNYGPMLARDHGKAKDEAMKVEQSLRIVVPAAAEPEAQTEYDKLSKLSGTAFDVQFLLWWRTIRKRFPSSRSKRSTEAP